ncbi:hypothetical protein NP493_568g01001 [Ridgeia piscesae]|uniref:Nudix hydrolase domain-containing protein n=1 Tax=Ridgeia piscesae TaxID=27915 RepID=A0AAD9KUN8_RIDPI|nr:hypothetical protein NP493_568g01001 [Ridgeia piscesae]
MKRAWEDTPPGPPVGAPRKQEINVSVLVPADDPGQYLLRYYPDRGWWLPSGKVARDEEIQLTAKRIASEIAETRIHLQGIMRTAYIRQTGCEDNAIHIYFLAHPVRVAVTQPNDVRSWFTLEEMHTLLRDKNDLMGPEPIELIDQLDKGASCAPVTALVETEHNFYDVSTESSLSSPQEMLIKAARFSREGERCWVLSVGGVNV